MSHLHGTAKTRNHRVLMLAALVAILAALIGTGPLRAEPGELSRTDALFIATHKAEVGAGTRDMIWWLAPQYWESLEGDWQGIPGKNEQIAAILRSYPVVAITEVSLNAEGDQVLEPEADSISNTRLMLNDGTLLPPVDPSLLPIDVAEVKVLLEGNVDAPFMRFWKDSINVLIFPRLDDPRYGGLDFYLEGSFLIHRPKRTIRYVTPIALNPPRKLDETTGEEFSGHYSFNPYTGKQLSLKVDRNQVKAETE